MKSGWQTAAQQNLLGVDTRFTNHHPSLSYFSDLGEQKKEREKGRELPNKQASKRKYERANKWTATHTHTYWNGQDEKEC